MASAHDEPQNLDMKVILKFLRIDSEKAKLCISGPTSQNPTLLCRKQLRCQKRRAHKAKAIMSVCLESSTPGSHSHLLCGNRQIDPMFRPLVRDTEDLEDSSDDEQGAKGANGFSEICLIAMQSTFALYTMASLNYI